MAADQRLARLLGDGRQGGGVPLPDAFVAVVQALLDDGPKTTPELTFLLSTVMGYKSARVMAVWRDWGEFALDILAQLEESGAIITVAGLWFITKGFPTRERHIVIPSAGIGIVAYSRREREQRSAMARARLDVRRVAAALREAGVDDPELHQLLALAATRLDTEEEEKPRESGRLPPRLPRPTAQDLARERYGLGGGPVITGGHPFGEDGKRACSKCAKRKAPEEFFTYWDGAKAGGEWYLRASCTVCWKARVKDSRAKKKKEQQ